MNKFTYLFRSASVCLLLSFLLFSRGAIAADSSFEQTSTGWLTNFNHPPVSLQMQLTGESAPLLKTVNAVLQVQLEGDWKTYWRAPGEGGEAPRFDFSQSVNIADVVWAWPAPKRYNVLGVDTLGYKGVINFPLTLHLQDPAKPVLLKGVLTIASCTTLCVLSDYEIELQFTSAGLVINDDAAFTYQQALAAVPTKLNRQTIASNLPITAWHSAWDNNKQILTLEIENRDGWHFPDIFVDSAAADLIGVTFSAPEISISDKRMTAQIPVSSWAGKLDLNKHLLNFTVVDNSLAVELLSIPGEQLPGEPKTLLAVFVIALIGGLILNIMPCVLPVLAMKLSSILATEGINRRQIRIQFIVSSAGILSSFWLLAAFLLILKLSGQALGWGIQFQNPYFISVMVVITALFAANMLDIFTIQLPVKAQTWLATRGSQSYLGHYLQGMFATLLATPCSAPFVGTAVAFSFAASSWQLFIIFSALGLGMALPWLLIALFPAIALYLPKPGNWMNALKSFFALLILMTSYWLLSLLSSFIGQNLLLLTALLLTVVLLFLIAKKRGTKLFVVFLSAILASALTVVIINSLTGNKGSAASAQLQWLPLDRNVIDRQVQQGKVVFVDVTADWCVTCKANKIGVLLQEPVYSLLQKEDIITMKGDWTVASDSVMEYLQSYGRFAVPFNIVYGPGAPQGIPLKTILTTDAVLAAVQQAKEK